MRASWKLSKNGKRLRKSEGFVDSASPAARLRGDWEECTKLAGFQVPFLTTAWVLRIRKKDTNRCVRTKSPFIGAMLLSEIGMRRGQSQCANTGTIGESAKKMASSGGAGSWEAVTQRRTSERFHQYDSTVTKINWFSRLMRPPAFGVPRLAPPDRPAYTSGHARRGRRRMAPFPAAMS